MRPIETQSFELSKNFALLMKGSLLIFVGFLMGGFYLLYLSITGSADRFQSDFVVALLCILVFGAFVYYAWRIIKTLPYTNISIDQDGLWYSHLSKSNSLISWDTVAHVKERPNLQRLDLLDNNGNKLIKVEYQLNGFEILRDIIQERLPNKVNNSTSLPVTFTKKVIYHFITWAALIGFTALGLYVGSHESPWMGYGGMSILLILILHEYATTVSKLTIKKEGMVVGYPFKTHIVSYHHIESVDMADSFYNGSRIPEVWVKSSVTDKVIKIKQLGVDASALLALLRNTYSKESL